MDSAGCQADHGALDATRWLSKSHEKLVEYVINLERLDQTKSYQAT